MATIEPEAETKYDVDDDCDVPELRDLPGVARLGGPSTLRLEATYFDTADLVLGRQGITLRCRQGGVDDGWHLKLPTQAAARMEVRLPVGSTDRIVPDEFRRVVEGLVRDGELRPVATISTVRAVQGLFDAGGTLLAEFCDDRVHAQRHTPDGDEEHLWREWELELHGADRTFAKSADVRIQEAGAKLAGGVSKAGRVLQVGPVHDQVEPLSKRATEHELLGRHLWQVAADVHRLDPLVRADVADAVHQLRVRVRRLRSTLRIFECSFVAAVTTPVREDLAWLGDVLGRPRDLEVLREHLDGLLASESTDLVRGQIRTWMGGRLRVEHVDAHRAALEAMSSDRYFTLVDTLDRWAAEPPWTDDTDRSARKRLPKALRRARSRLRKAVSAAALSSGQERVANLHAARRQAKRTRYAAEVLTPILEKEARVTARAAENVQIVLGDHHDAVVAAGHVRRLADAAHVDGRDGFTLGILQCRLEAEASAHEAHFERAWKKWRKDL